jgi:hypothetical protein
VDFHKFDGKELGLVYIPKDTDPQEYAMMAAWFSRSTDTVEDMVSKVSEEGTTKFIEKFYVGYGHESIGDLVDVKMFIHGIPLYLAPLIEHYALFRGQESSTRYIDFSKQRLYGKDQDLMKIQINEYLRALDHVTNKLLELNAPETPIQINAVKARAFDICRSLLPLGATTNVAWFGDIRSIKGHLAWMLQYHPWSAPWVEHIYDSLKAVYPASMEKELINIRPRMPWVFDENTSALTFSGTIDFGSWRDLNRHRVGRQSFRLPERNSFFDGWYYQMFDFLGFQIKENLYDIVTNSKDPGTLLLGLKVPFKYEMPESQAEYFVWRRYQMDVHPTLRLKVQDFGLEEGFLTEKTPDVGLGYVERRGTQTIFHRPEAK